MRKLFFCIALLSSFALGDVRHIAAQEPFDGRNRIFRDEMLDNLVGDWKLTRKMRAQSLENRVKAEWALNHSSYSSI